MSVGIEAQEARSITESVALEEPRASGGDSRDGRDRLLAGARKLLAEKGYAGMELRDVAAAGNAPRGSIYHHFPGGKRQLAAEATALEGVQIHDTIERALGELGVKQTLRMFGKVFSRRAADHPERIGCPVAAAALARPEDPALAAAATAAFQSWEQPIAAALERE
jgi:AcrR family transcriptional regulator